MKIVRFVTLTALVIITIVACTSRDRTIKLYQIDGIQFSYYSDWTVVKDTSINGNSDYRSIHIEGPDQALVSLVCLPMSNNLTLEDFATSIAKNRDKVIESNPILGSLNVVEVSKGISKPTTGIVAGQEQQGILQQFSIDLLGKQVPHEAKYYLVRGLKYRVFIMSQVATTNSAPSPACR